MALCSSRTHEADSRADVYKEYEDRIQTVAQQFNISSGEMWQVDNIYERVRDSVSPGCQYIVYCVIMYLIRQLSYDDRINTKKFLQTCGICTDKKQFSNLQILLLDQVDFSLY